MNRLLVTCCWGFIGFLACNSPPRAPSSCTIQGTAYLADQANPSNPCQVCAPTKGFSTWTDLPTGSACGSSGTVFCSGGACLPGCLIASTFYPAGSSNPGNGCQSCEPSKTASDWTGLSGVVPNACANGQVCQEGACTSGCAIGSNFFAASATNPQNTCQSCQPILTEIAWSDLAPGSDCADGGGICNAGSCQSGCLVGGVFFGSGTYSQTNVCRSCQPAVSTTSFSPFTGVAPGGACDGGAYCDQGSCSGGCAIEGTTEVPGTLNPANPCQSCQPSVNLTAWSDVSPGTGCGAGGAVCAGGVCLLGCEVGGILYAPGSTSPTNSCKTCQPAVSASSFSPFTGLPAGGCSGGETCNQGTCEVACFIRGAVIASRSYKPNDTGFCCSPGSDPTNWTQSFTRAGTYSAGSGYSYGFGPTQTIAAGDFNGDGFQDVAVVNSLASTVSIFLNKGDGTFQAQAVYPTGSNPQAVATGDLNGDHLDDLVVAVDYGAKLGVFFSRGFDAGFDDGLTTESDLTVTDGGYYSYQTLQIKDLNGDRAPDLVVGNGSQDDSVSVYLNLNDRTGGFGAEKTYNPGVNYATQVALGDFDGNGSPDIAILTGYFGGPSMAILFNDGSGGFSTGVSLPLDNYTNSVAAGDFNGDGFSDLAVATYYQTDTLLAVGDGGFFPVVSQPLTAADTLQAADLNGDGLADVVVFATNSNPGSINLLISQRTGGFAPASSIAASVASSFVIRDFNGDGAPDLAMMNYGGGTAQTWTLWLNSCP